MLDWLLTPEGWVALVSLISLEVVLGIDNIIFISILVGRLPPEQREKARIIGLSLAMISRLLLLASLFWIMKLITPLFSIMGHAVSGRDLILIFGGLFLLLKSTLEIHHCLEIKHMSDANVKAVSYGAILAQIALVDVIFSLDSVITAVGMVKHLSIMIIAVIVSIVVMMLAAKPLGDFVDRNPTVKILALAFLILIGVALIGEGLGVHIPKGYIYFAMAFSLIVELINIQIRKRIPTTPIQLSRFIQSEKQ